MRRTGKRLGALLLALVMVLSLLPMSALAARADDDELTIAAPESGNAAAVSELPTSPGDSAELLATTVTAEPANAIETSRYTMDADNAYNDASEGSADLAKDGNPETHYHTNWGVGKYPMAQRWVQIQLDSPAWISGLAQLPRFKKDNGGIARYEIQVSADGSSWVWLTDNLNGQAWDKGGTANTDSTQTWQMANFAPINTQYVKIYGVETSNGTATANGDMSIGELRLIGCTNDSPSTHSVTITVTDTSGNAINGATVSIAGQKQNTDSNGQVTISNLVNDEAYIGKVEDSNGNYADGKVTVAAASANTTVSVQLVAVTNTLTGKVLTTTGDPVNGATVELVNNTAATVGSFTATVNESGAYTFDISSVDAGNYYVRAKKDSTYASTPITVNINHKVESQDYNVTLDPIDITKADYGWNFNGADNQPGESDLNKGSNVTITYPDNNMRVTWADGSRSQNLVSIANTNMKNGIIEFTATRGTEGTNEGDNTNNSNRFGIALRRTNTNNPNTWVYLGQENGKVGLGWGVEYFTIDASSGESSSGSNWSYSGFENSVSFKAGDTRHFKVIIQDTKISLIIDGIPVLTEKAIPGVTDGNIYAGDVGLIWGNTSGYKGDVVNHTVTIDDLCVFSTDAKSTISWTDPDGATLSAQYTFNNQTKDVNNGVTSIPEGAPITVSATVSDSNYGLDSITVTPSEESVTAPTVTKSTTAENTFTFTMPACPVTVSGTLKLLVGTPTVAENNDIFRVGKTLTATPADGNTVNYQWYRHEADRDPVLIEDATEQTYTLVSADEGKTIFVKVTGTGDYTGWAQSAETTAILPAVVEVPENGITFTRANGITMWLNDHSGETTGPVVGTTTTVTANVDGSPTKPLTVTWESNATDIATIEAIEDTQNGNLTATLTAKKVGNATITVKMTAKDGTVERSATLNVTVKAHITGIAVKNGETAVTEQAPLYLYANSDDELSAINGGSGGTKVNHAVLTAELTEPTGGASANEKRLDWARSDMENQLINFSTSDDTLTYTVDPASKANTAESNAKVGVKTITVSSHAKPTVTTSFKIYVVRHLVNDVTINGTAQVGKDLTAGIQQLNIPTDKESGLTYKWTRLDSENAATGTEVGTDSTYTVQANDAGKYIRLEVTAAVNETSGFFYEGVKTAVTAQIAKKAGPDAPINLVGVKPSDESTNNGKITGLDRSVTYEYKVKTDSNWTEISNATEIPGLTGNTVYEVRVKVADTNAQELGAATEVRIPAYDENYKTITITQPEHGTVTTSPAGSAEPDSQVTITATPAEGYAVDTVTVTDADNGPVEVTENKFTMPDKDVTVTVTFHPTQITIHHVLENMTCSLAETEAAQGTNSHQVTYGVDPEITLIPAADYKLPNTLYNQEAGTGIFTDEAGTQRYNHYTFNETTGRITFNADYFPTQDLWIKAKATKITHNVAYTAQTGYTAPTGGRDVDHNGTYTVTITPNDGYRMPANITVKMKDANGVYQTLDTSAYTYTPNTDKTSADISIPNITGDVQITITCEEITYAITGVSITITHNDTATVEQDIPHVGDTLHANVTHEAPSGTPVTATYQWYRGTAPISGTTGSTYTVTADDLGQAIKVVVTGNKPFSDNATSTATNAVKAKVIHVGSVTVTPATATLIVGKTQQLTATVTPSYATNQKVTWGSDDDTVATVSETGLVTAVSAGTTTIRATTEDGGKTSTCAVTVEAAPETGVILTGSAQVGEKLTAEIFPADVTYTIKWVRVAEDNTETELTETGLEYTLVEADKGSKIKVVVTIEEQEYTAESGTVTAAPVILKPKIKLSASPASLPTSGGDVVLTVTVPEEITNGTVTVTCGTEGIEITKNEEDGTYAVTLPEGRATYTFTATLTAGTLEDGTAYDSAEATCTVRVGSRPATSTTPTTPSETTSTQVKEDGTKVTTVTKPDGTVTETTEAPDGTVAVVETKKDGTVTETVSQPDGTKSEAITTPEGDKTITVTDAEGEEIAKVELPAEIPAPEAKFEDVTQAAPWAEEAINKVAGLKLVEGTGNNKYDPISPMTRGALATVLHRLSQGKTDYEVTFQDVAAGKYYTEGVAWAAKVNVVKGLSEDVFAPEQVITREQLAVMLARYAKLIGMDTKADAKALDQFADGSATNDWAVDGVAWCVENGILQGKGADVLDPGNNVTRAEVAVMLDRFIALMK